MHELRTRVTAPNPMIDSISIPVAPVEGADRRAHARQPTSSAFAELNDDDNVGSVFDVSEGGLALCLLKGLDIGYCASMRIRFSECGRWSIVKARVVWTSESKKVAGIEFLNLTPALHNEIRSLSNSGLSSGKFRPAELKCSTAKKSDLDADPIDVTVPEMDIADELFNETTSGATVQTLTESTKSLTINFREGFNRFKGRSAKLPFTYLIVLIALLSLILWRVKGSILYPKPEGMAHTILASIPSPKERVVSLSSEYSQMQQMASPPQAPRNRAQASVQTPQSLLVPSKRSLASLQTGFQVGAMASESNANSLAEDLRKKNFPAVIIHSLKDGLYRVVVGPYQDGTDLIKVKVDLEKQGLVAFQTRLRQLNR